MRKSITTIALLALVDTSGADGWFAKSSRTSIDEPGQPIGSE
jgi:hypothetical protein